MTRLKPCHFSQQQYALMSFFFFFFCLLFTEMFLRFCSVLSILLHSLGSVGKVLSVPFLSFWYPRFCSVHCITFCSFYSVISFTLAISCLFFFLLLCFVVLLASLHSIFMFQFPFIRFRSVFRFCLLSPPPFLSFVSRSLLPVLFYTWSFSERLKQLSFND